MSDRRPLLWLLAAALLLCSCEEAAAPAEPTRHYEASPAVCDDGPAAPSMAVYPDVQTIGEGSNVIAEGAGYLWVVESLANTVSRFDPATGDLDAFFIDVGDGRNPYDVHIDAANQLAYITNWAAHTLTVASTATGEVVDEIGADSDAFDSPQGVTASDDYIYVTNSAFTASGYEDGSVTILDRDTREVLGRVATAQKNPSYATYIDTPNGPRVAIVNAGVIDAAAGGVVRSDGGVELWRETDDPTAPARQTFTLPTTDDERLGAPGRPAVTPDGTRLYLPSATAPVLFELDLAAGAWLHDTADPLVVYDTDEKALHNAAIDARGILYLTAFNDDALYLVDTSCNAVLAGPIDLASTHTQLEGPLDVRVVDGPEGPTAFFLMSLANAMGKVELGR